MQYREEKWDDEEELKTIIYNTYSKARHESSYGNKLELIHRLIYLTVRWCKDYLKYGKIIEKIGLDIVKIFIIDKKDREKIEGIKIEIKIDMMPEEKNAFFENLLKKLNNIKFACFKSKRESQFDPINIPRIYKEMKNIILIEEKAKNRRLTVNEQILCVSRWKQWPENKTRKYMEVMKRKFIRNLFCDDNGKVKDAFEYDNQKDGPHNSMVETEYFTNYNAAVIRNAIEAVLMNTEDKECCRELYTLYCLKKIKDFEELCPVLDGNIIESQKQEENITLAKIFKKYHPEVTDESATTMSSRMLNTFLKKLRMYLENNHELFK